MQGCMGGKPVPCCTNDPTKRAWHAERCSGVNIEIGRAAARRNASWAGWWGAPKGCEALREIGGEASASEVGNASVRGRSEVRRGGQEEEKVAWLRPSGRSDGSDSMIARESAMSVLLGLVEVGGEMRPHLADRISILQRRGRDGPLRCF